MYKIIGADGREYGPIGLEQITQWIKEGRLNAQSKVLPEGTTEWKPLGDLPELAAIIASLTQPLSAAAPSVRQFGAADAANEVTGPAIGLIVTAVLGFVGNILGIVYNMVFAASMAATSRSGNPEIDRIMSMFTGTIGMVSGVVAIAVSVLVLIGAIKMKSLQSRAWAMTAAILAIVPCISPCCCVGVPVGIWALVVLSKDEVKAAFLS